MGDTKTKDLFHTCTLNYNTHLTQKDISWRTLHMNPLNSYLYCERITLKLHGYTTTTD